MMPNPKTRVRSSRGSRVAALLTFSLSVLMLSAGSAAAQVIDIPMLMSPDLKAPPTAVALRYGHQFETDVEDGGSEMSRDTAFFSVAHRIQLSEKSTFMPIGSYTVHNYDFSSNTGTPYQWNTIHRAVIGGLFGYELNDAWSLVYGAQINSFGENGASFGDSLSGGVLGGFDYHPDDDFSIGLVVGLFSAIEDSVGILPVPTMRWNFAEGWKWQVGLVAVVDNGIGSELSYAVSDTVSLGGGIAFQNRRFRLRDKTRAGRVAPPRNDDGGVGQESQTPIFLNVAWRPTPKTALTLMGGVAVAGNLRVEDDDGDRIADDSYDAAGFLSLKGTILF